MAIKVALIYPRFAYPSGDFSIGLASIGASLRKHIAGIELSLIDSTFHPGLSHVRGRLAAERPDIAAIYSDTLMFEDAVKVARACKELGALVIVGGPHPTILPELTLAVDAIDAVGIGEGEETAREFVECVSEGKNLDSVRGIWFKRDGKVVKNPPRPTAQDLDALPFPAVDLYETERYIKAFVQLDSYLPNLRGMSLVASRGCPFQCGYCQPTLTRLFGSKLRIRSTKSVVEEILLLRDRYALDAFYFQDDTLTVFRDWIRDFCSRMIQERVGMVWACNTRADTCDDELFSLMRRAGCVKIKVGIESVTDRIRNGIYRKNISMGQVDALTRSASGAGIQVAGFFMLGAPTETIEEMNDTIRYAVASGLVEANFSIATALPLTDLWETARQMGWNLPDHFRSYDYYKATRPSLAHDDVSRRTLDRLRRKAVLQFYLHPKRIGKLLSSLSSRTGVTRLRMKLKRF